MRLVPTAMGVSRKAMTLGLGGFGVAAALTAAAWLAPSQLGHAAASYVPTNVQTVLARVPVRNRDEVVARETLAAQPAQLDLALPLAQIEIARATRTSDPRHLGQAQALLAPWWNLPTPPADVLLLRATIRQALHEFPAALQDLESLLIQQPAHVQALLTRAVVATVIGDFALARRSCAALQGHVSGLVAATCVAPLDAMVGQARMARTRLSQALATADEYRPANPAIVAWAHSTLAEIAVIDGDYATAEIQLHELLAADPEDNYARALMADILLASNRAAAAATLLVGHDAVDNLIVRRAIATHLAGDPAAVELRATLRARIAAAAERHDRLHAREEAMFVLRVENDPARALLIAVENWQVQKELTDARLLVQCARAAGDRGALEIMTQWVQHHGIVDAQLTAGLR